MEQNPRTSRANVLFLHIVCKIRCSEALKLNGNDKEEDIMSRDWENQYVTQKIVIRYIHPMEHMKQWNRH